MIKLELVTFYQAVRLGGKPYNTVSKEMVGARDCDMFYDDGLVFVHAKTFAAKDHGEKVHIVPNNNLRHAIVDIEDFKKSKYWEAFKSAKIAANTAGKLTVSAEDLTVPHALPPGNVELVSPEAIIPSAIAPMTKVEKIHELSQFSKAELLGVCEELGVEGFDKRNGEKSIIDALMKAGY